MGDTKFGRPRFPAALRGRAGTRAMLLPLIIMLVLALPAVGIAQARKGAWVDAVVFVREPSPAAAISRVEANDFQVWFGSSAIPEHRERILRNPKLASAVAYGLYHEITFNPVGPVFATTPPRLNPFAVPKVREAMNFLISRKHIGDEIMGGLGVQKYFPISTAFPDYARLADVARKLEILYAHNPDKAKATISEEMGKLGATLVGGKWQYQGRPVTLTFLIRTEDERRQIGDYTAGLLEGLGFTIERRYGTAGDLSPLWIGGDPAAGAWHLYTGGWITLAIARDQAGNFNFFYTPRGQPVSLWQAYKPAPAFDGVADRLARRDFSTMSARSRLFAQGLELSMQDSVRVWLVDRLSVSPLRAEVKVVPDLAGGIGGSRLWPYTLRYEGREGGTIKIGNTDMLVEPWNAIAGTNWFFDQNVIRATQDWATMPDPFTGLFWPQRIERAEVSVKRGFAVARTLDWVSLKVVPENKVPDDAVISWDAKAQRFITVREKHPQGLASNTKTVVYFEKNLYKNVQWHDGSLLSMADIMLSWILTFDRAMEGSAIYDPAAVPSFRTFERDFRGFRIVSENPLVAEYYSDVVLLDAEAIAATAAGAFMPNYSQGPGAWHTLGLGIRAEAAGDVAFSAAKARRQNVEWLSYVAGPTLAILDRHLEAARTQNYVPYASVLGKHLKPEEIATRWKFLTHWRQGRGHYWVGFGPFLLQRVSPVEKITELRRFGRFPDPSTRWLHFTEPKLAAVAATGPSSVKSGDEAAFDVRITFKGRPYPPGEIEEVKYLLFDGKGQLINSGKVGRSGDWKIVLAPEVTQKLAPGSNRLEVIVVSRVVSIPTFATVSFTTLPK